MLAVLDQRLKTQTLLTLRADHARARDAVMLDVHQDVIDNLKLFSVQTRCQDKNEFLTRPDLGRRLSEDGVQKVKDQCIRDRCAADRGRWPKFHRY